MIGWVHLAATIFASWRLTELVVMDKLTEPIRKRFPVYFLTCLRCVSIWAGLASLVVYHFFPWANWPIALSWIYVQYVDGRIARKQVKEGRRLVVVMDQQNIMTLERLELTPPELEYMYAQIKQRTAA